MQNQTLDSNQIQKIIKLYTEGKKTPKEIGKEMGIHAATVGKLLRRNNVQVHTISLSESELSEIKRLYLEEKKSTIEISEIYHIHDTTVAEHLKRMNVPMRTIAEATRILNIKDDYFSNIETEKQAYFLGFCFAKASVSNEPRREIKTLLQEDKIEVLEKFSQELYGKSAIKYQKKGDVKYPFIMITCKKMHEDLGNLGLHQKSYITNMPSLKKELNHHFLRGFADFNMNIAKTATNAPLLEFKTYNNVFTKSIQNYLANVLNLTVLTSSNNTVDFYGLTESKTVLNHLYKDSTIHLTSKYAEYQNFLKF